jgi:serine phosphatase RsbU (regulator of sigma subunit)
VSEVRDLSRRGPSLSARLIVATSLLLAVAVAAAAWFGIRTIDRNARADAAARRTSGEAAIRREAELLARHVAGAAAVPLAGSSYADLTQVVQSARQEYDRVRWLMVIDRQDPAGRGNVVAHTGGAPAYDGEADDVTAELAAARPDAVVSRPGDDGGFSATQIRLGDRVLGEVRLGISTADLADELAASLRAADARAERSLRDVLLAAIAILAIGVVVAAAQALRMSRPLRALTQQASRIAGGDLQHRVPVTSGDEIGTLALHFNFMADRLVELMQEYASKMALEREMLLAREVQQAMIPPPRLVVHGDVKLVGHCAPASSCGGDWWMYRALADGRVLLVVGDTTGHGLHSAMVAATARGAVEALANHDERLLEPEPVLRAIDAAIRNIGDHSLVMTCFAAVADASRGLLRYANAGHNFPYVVHQRRDRAHERTSVIAASGNPLGDRNVSPLIRTGQRRLEAGDLLVMFTDGVVERSNRAGKLFGDRRLRNTLLRKAPGEGESLVAMRDLLLGELERFAEGQAAEDDVTVVLCLYDPAARSLEAAS